MAEFGAGLHDFVRRRVEQRNFGKSIYMEVLLARKGSIPKIRQFLNVRQEDFSGLGNGFQTPIGSCTQREPVPRDWFLLFRTSEVLIATPDPVGWIYHDEKSSQPKSLNPSRRCQVGKSSP